MVRAKAMPSAYASPARAWAARLRLARGRVALPRSAQRQKKRPLPRVRKRPMAMVGSGDEISQRPDGLAAGSRSPCSGVASAESGGVLGLVASFVYSAARPACCGSYTPHSSTVGRRSVDEGVIGMASSSSRGATARRQGASVVPRLAGAPAFEIRPEFGRHLTRGPAMSACSRQVRVRPYVSASTARPADL